MSPYPYSHLLLLLFIPPAFQFTLSPSPLRPGHVPFRFRSSPSHPSLPPFPPSPPPPSPTALPASGGSGNLFDRFARVAKANVNSVLKKLEDPEKVMEQALDDMQSDLVKVRQSYAEVFASKKRMGKERGEAERMGEQWYERAGMAMKKGDEELAREGERERERAGGWARRRICCCWENVVFVCCQFFFRPAM